MGLLLNLGHLLDVQLCLLSQLWPFIGRKDLATVVQVLVISRLDYSSMLCVGLPLKNVWKRQLVENAAASMLA